MKLRSQLDVGRPMTPEEREKSVRTGFLPSPSDRDIIPVKKLCPCGCGRYLPEPVRTLHVGPAGKAIEEWLADQGLTLEDVRARDNHLDMVEARRRIAYFLSDHGWGDQRIADFIARERTTIRALRGKRKRS
jgi:hypothetical protein